MKVVLEIQDTKKGKVLLDFLKQLSFVKLEDQDRPKSFGDINELFGIWRDRQISKENLRSKAWRI